MTKSFYLSIINRKSDAALTHVRNRNLERIEGLKQRNEWIDELLVERREAEEKTFATRNTVYARCELSRFIYRRRPSKFRSDAISFLDKHGRGWMSTESISTFTWDDSVARNRFTVMTADEVLDALNSQ